MLEEPRHPHVGAHVAAVGGRVPEDPAEVRGPDGQSCVCGSMIAITINVQIATTIQPIARSQRAPRSPPSSTESSSSVSHGASALGPRARERTANRPPPADRRDRRRRRRPRRSGCRTRSTACQARTPRSRFTPARLRRRDRARAQLSWGLAPARGPRRASSTPVSSCQLFASHRAQRWNTTSRPAIRIRIVISAPFAHRVQACIGGLPAL